MKKYFLFLLIIISIFLACRAYAEVTVNSGFIPGQIWYSKDALVEGDIVNVHTAVWNGSGDSLSTKIEFYDKNVILGSRDIVLASSELKDVYIPWKITSGDHLISAKIIASTATVSGKKEKVSLEHISTSSDKQFVSVVAKNNLGEAVSGTDALKTQIDKVSSDINNVVPEKISTPVVNSFSVIDAFRSKTSAQVDTTKNETKKEIDSLTKNEAKSQSVTTVEKSNIGDATQKPIAYIKLFLFSVLSFILGSKIVFYGILTLIVFYILRSVYRKIRNR